MSTGYLCKRCGAESPTGIGYAASVPTVLPAPAADCPNPHVFTCSEDSGSMTDCRPVCDAPATYVVTRWPSYGAPYVSHKCERHARHTSARHYPDRVELRPL